MMPSIKRNEDKKDCGAVLAGSLSITMIDYT